MGLNDNLARELLELHTVTPSANYTEDDIRAAAKILSGWGFIFNKQKDAEWAEKTLEKTIMTLSSNTIMNQGIRWFLARNTQKASRLAKKPYKA